MCTIEGDYTTGTSNKYEKICLQALTTINRVAVVAISLFKVPGLFISFFALGTGMSFFNNKYHWYEEKKIDVLDVAVSCVLQAFENVAGQKFPKVLGLAIAVITTLHHCMEDEGALIFGPISGYSLGMWAGSNLWHMSHHILFAETPATHVN